MLLPLLGSFNSVQAKGQKRYKFSKKRSIKNIDNLKSVYDEKLHRSRVVGDQIIVKFKKSFRKSNIQKFALKNNLRVIKKLGKRHFVFVAQDQDSMLDILNNLENNQRSKAKDLIVDADLDEYKKLEKNARRARNSKKQQQRFPFSSQWHLRNDGGDSVSKAGSDINVEEAWGQTKGSGIIVAVIDTGFDIKHNDINFLNKGYTTVNRSYNAKAPSFSTENHGTAVAGLIAAKENGFGTTGVAPEAKIVPIRLIGSGGYVSTSQIIEAHEKAVEMGARIINNSWGSYDSTLEDGEQMELSDLEKNLYKHLATKANGGRGVTVIFAAGNSRDSNFNAHPEARSQYTLAIGAINSKDRKTRYSVYGKELDLVAPGGEAKGILTTDRRDKKRRVLGYAQGNYTDTFSGTSAAAPIVSGVAALVLAANPNLTAIQVKDILRQSARGDLDSYYKFDSNGKNNEIGYGVVDAGKAVKLAKSMN